MTVPGHMTVPGRQCVALTMAMSALVIAFFSTDHAESPIMLSAAIGSTGLALGSAIVMSWPRWASASTLYAAVFAAFHVGLLIPVSAGLEVPLLNPYDSTWANPQSLAPAAALITLAAACLALAFAAVPSVSGPEAPRVVPHDGLALVGTSLTLGSLVAWNLVLFSRGGLVLLDGGYLAWLRATANAPLPWIYLGLGIGMAFVSASRVRGAIAVTLGCFSLWTLLAIPLGLRGEVLLPALAFLLVAARRRLVKWHNWYLLGGLGALALGSVIRAGRVSGFKVGTWTPSDANPLLGLVEMGYSVKPLVYVRRWHYELREDFVGFGTYTAPVERLVLGRLLGLPTIPAAEDARVFSTTVAERVGPIGGSPVAESYRAAGIAGVLIVMIFIGVVLRILDRLPSTPGLDAVAGSGGYVLLLWVRNDFTPVPLEVLMIMLALAAATFGNLLSRRTGRPLERLATVRQ